MRIFGRRRRGKKPGEPYPCIRWRAAAGRADSKRRVMFVMGMLCPGHPSQPEALQSRFQGWGACGRAENECRDTWPMGIVGRGNQGKTPGALHPCLEARGAEGHHPCCPGSGTTSAVCSSGSSVCGWKFIERGGDPKVHGRRHVRVSCSGECSRLAVTTISGFRRETQSHNAWIGGCKKNISSRSRTSCVC